MATLKEHQAAMVDLLANGSGIPASASRLAHAMHDVLEVLNLQPGDAAWRVTTYNQTQELFSRTDATTPGLNDKALSDCVEACRPKATPAERRVKELENTISQLKANNAKLRQQIAECAPAVDLWGRWSATPPEHDAMPEPACEHDHTTWRHELGDSVEIEYCDNCQRVLSERPV